MDKRKICVVTGTRAEYGLLYWLMKEIQADNALELQIIATGAHLSPEFGLTYKTIERDGFVIDEKVEMLLSGDTPTAITKSMGLGLIGFADGLNRLKPEVMVLLGDRYEALVAAQAAMVACVPIAHIHGGEATEGLIDEAIRHSITKMSLLHFTAAEEYRRRIIQLGESPDRVFNFGAIGLDNIRRLKLLSKEEFSSETGFQWKKINFLVTYHPVTLEKGGPEDAMQALFDALDAFPNVGIIFTQANSDTDGRLINSMTQEYVARHKDRMLYVKTLGQVRYLSAVRFMDAVIGNSSSGILEVPSFRVPSVNLGARQRGRLMAPSVINCEETCADIQTAIKQAISPEFRENIRTMESPFGNGGVSEKIVDVLKTVDLSPERIMKKFQDVEFVVP